MDALVAAAVLVEGCPLEGRALSVFAALVHAHAGASGCAASDWLLPFIVGRMRAVAAGAASRGAALKCQGVLRLLTTLTLPSVGAAARAAVLATLGLVAAVVDLLVALGSQEWAAVREEWEAERGASVELWEELERPLLMTLVALIPRGGAGRDSPLGALTSRCALPRLVALLRSPNVRIRMGASGCIFMVATTDEGRDALSLVPRAASELAAALRRAHANGEDPSMTQFNAAHALSRLLEHRQSARVADGLASAAMAEGSAGPLLGALAGLLTASAAGGDLLDMDWQMFECASTVAFFMAIGTQQGERQVRLRPVLQRSPLAQACVRALAHWLPKASDEQMRMVWRPVGLVGILAGFNAQQGATAPADIPAVTADTAAARAALREAPGMAGALRRYLAWGQGHLGEINILVMAAAGFLLMLPEVAAPRAAAASQAAATAAPAGAAAGPASAAPAPAPALAAAAAAAAAPPPAAVSLSVEQQSRDGASGDGGCSGEAPAPPRACGGCARSEPEVRLLRCVGCKAQYYCGDACARAHWPSHRAACKAAARRASAARRL